MLSLRFPWGFYPLECRRRTYLWWFFLPIPKGLATTGYYLRYHLTNSISRSSYLNSFLVIWWKYFWGYSNVNEYTFAVLFALRNDTNLCHATSLHYPWTMRKWLIPTLPWWVGILQFISWQKKTEQFCCDKSVDRDEMINIVKICEICFTFFWESLIVWQVINTWTTRGVCV